MIVLLVVLRTLPGEPEANDGPRHVKAHLNKKILYCVTEHCKFFMKMPMTQKHHFDRNLVNLVKAFARGIGMWGVRGIQLGCKRYPIGV